MVFAAGPEEALAKVAETDFDVVVSDMRMPHMDGADLLARIKQVQPKAVRMILTGQTEQESVMKSVFIAHVFLSKPCDPDFLRAIVDRACNLSSMLDSQALRAAAGRVDMLPAAPRTYVALNEALVKASCSAGDVAKIIEGDVGLCAKILQLVNSAFFGLPRNIKSLSEAVTYLGTLTIKNLAMALEVFASSPERAGLSSAELDELQAHSLLAGQIARRIAPRDKGNPDEAFLAGLLHEVGRLIRIDEHSTSAEAPPMDRALLGAYLLGLWGLPHPIMESVAFHRQPRLVPHTTFELVDVIYLAHHLAAELRGAEPEALDLSYLDGIGIGSGELEHMREEARRLGEAQVGEAAG